MAGYNLHLHTNLATDLHSSITKKHELYFIWLWIAREINSDRVLYILITKAASWFQFMLTHFLSRVTTIVGGKKINPHCKYYRYPLLAPTMDLIDMMLSLHHWEWKSELGPGKKSAKVFCVGTEYIYIYENIQSNYNCKQIELNKWSFL